MPLTFPSHLAPVLPLKLWFPRWFDGVALAAGSVAPDVAYLALGTRAELPDTHSLSALIWWCLPVALVYTWIVRRTVPAVAAHLPGRWSAVGGLGQVRHAWWIMITSALVGAASHLGWDWLTHTDGWLQALFGIDWYEATGIAWWTVSDLLSTVLGAGVVALVIVRRPDLFMTGTGRRPVRTGPFWLVALLSFVVGLAVLPFLPAAGQLGATGVRLLHLVGGSLLVGVLVERVRSQFRDRA
ncbi:protein of unknown function [Micromonospora pallida]|uniref:DUF4184 family protein n=1 Tax=Micromonospora pallida TaxID=145854 RepID=A0A1C6RRE5_9ACTN|nr:DUF4184 family protein [Micromonospora pallida]SCL19757.1 protein of unknown function [Micromonospora pallida]